MTIPMPSLRHVHTLFVFTILLNALMPFLMRLQGAQMYPFYFILLAWIGVYTLFLALLVRKHRLGDYRSIAGGKSLIIAVVLTLVTRFAFLGMTELISLDSLWYLDFGSLIKMGKVPYFDFYFPYPPVFAYITAAITCIAPSVDSFRVIMTAADIGVGLVLCQVAQKCVARQWGPSMALMYALLPIAVIESGWTGHFEALTNLLMLTAVWFMLARRPMLTGLFTGLAAATKIYPALLFPIAFLYFSGWRQRMRLTLAATVSGGLTFLPLLIQVILPVTPSPPGRLLGLDLVGLQLGALLGAGPAWPGNTLAIVGAALVLVASLWHLRKKDLGSSSTAYNLGVLLLGGILVSMGALAGVYPLTAESRLVLWRYPADIGIVKGLCIIIIGAAVMLQAARGLKGGNRKSPSAESLGFLGLAVALLLMSMSRLAVFGWYLLWSLPIFLLLKNRQLALTVTLCLLLVYPGYTTDNFSSLGFQEQRVWSDEMTSVGNWSVHVNTLGSCADPDQISAGVELNGYYASFWFDTSGLANTSCLENVTIQYAKAVNTEFGPLTEFVTRIETDWDPTFGQRAGFALAYQAVLENGTSVVAIIIPASAPITNLTWTSWRYAFMSDFDGLDGLILNLTITVTPRCLIRSEYRIDSVYTTYDGPLDIAYLPIVTSLIAVVLVSYVLLRKELLAPADNEPGATSGEQLAVFKGGSL